MRSLFLLLLPTGVFAQGITPVPYPELQNRLTEIIDFESFDKYLTPGTKLDGVQNFGGLSAAERFFGQFVEDRDGFDTLDGAPTGPLRLSAGKPSENLSVTFYFMLTNHLVGNAAPGYPESHAGGEGSISLLFDDDQSAIGFLVAAEPLPEDASQPKGQMTVTFYDRLGRRLDRLLIELEFGRSGYGFATANGQPEIAGITIENRDPAGIAIDDVIFGSTGPSS